MRACTSAGPAIRPQGIALPSPPDNWYPAALALVPGPAVDPDALAGYLKQFSQFTVLHAAQLGEGARLLVPL